MTRLAIRCLCLTQFACEASDLRAHRDGRRRKERAERFAEDRFLPRRVRRTGRRRGVLTRGHRRVDRTGVHGLGTACLGDAFNDSMPDTALLLELTPRLLDSSLETRHPVVNEGRREQQQKDDGSGDEN